MGFCVHLLVSDLPALTIVFGKMGTFYSHFRKLWQSNSFHLLCYWWTQCTDSCHIGGQIINIQ